MCERYILLVRIASKDLTTPIALEMRLIEVPKDEWLAISLEVHLLLATIPG
jgi:hypothetical protein